MKTARLYEEMLSSLKYDLYELVDDYDDDGTRITIVRDDSNPCYYIINVENQTAANVRYLGTGMRSASELITMAEDDFRRMVNEINYYSQLID